MSFAPIDHYDPRVGGHGGNRVSIEPRELAAIELARASCARDGGVMLDVGCGDGIFLAAIDAKLGLRARNWKLHGIDFSEARLEVARRRPYSFAQANVETGIPFADRSLDVIFCGELIEHLYDPDGFLAECHRVVVPGGLLVITTPNLQAWYNRLLFAAGIQPLFYEASTRSTAIGAGPLRRLKRGTTPVGHIRVFNRRAIVDLLASQGFRPVGMRGAEFVALPRPLRAVDRMLERVPSLASILVIASESISQPSSHRQE
jgi:2-polyprenyl-3-methyl-5-hydroxy-6-metoxy-1,4-benzoquinol methylase